MKVEETLSRWQAEEDAVRARLALTAGYARPEQIEALTGQQKLDTIFAGKLPRVPIGDTLGFLPIRIEHGLAIFQGRPEGKYYNPLGSIHGGWFAALLDSAVGCAVHSTLPAGKGSARINCADRIESEMHSKSLRAGHPRSWLGNARNRPLRALERSLGASHLPSIGRSSALK